MAFNGNRSTSGKGGGKGKAGEMFRDAQRAKQMGMAAPSQTEVYKKAIEARMQKMMEDIILGKKKQLPKLENGEDAPVPPPSKTAMMLIRMMAAKREANDRKRLKKRELDFKRQQNYKKWEQDQQKMYDEMLKQQAAEYEADQAAKSAAFWNNNSDNKSWW